MNSARSLRIWRSGDAVRIEANGSAIELDGDEVADMMAALRPGPPPLRFRAAELRQLYTHEQMTPKEIGERWGVSPKVVSVWITNFGIPAHSPAASEHARQLQAARKGARAQPATSDNAEA